MADDSDNSTKAWITTLGAPILLFILITGIAGSVDTKNLRESFKKWRGILMGCSCQFILLPLLGFSFAKIFQLETIFGISLIVTTASPGGAYSNWWCSLLNADLALSVAMTACSTLVSGLFLPINLLVYTTIAYGEVPELDMLKMLLNIGLAIAAIIFGTILSFYYPKRRKLLNVVGNVAGLCLIIFGAVVSSRDDPIWDKEAVFYPAVAAPCLCGLAASFTTAYFCPLLTKPEAVAVTVETVYQNTGLALSIVLATFDEEHRSTAAGVPIYYSVVQVVVLPLFMLVSWKLGFTYAPSSDRLHKVLLRNYQPNSAIVSKVAGPDPASTPTSQAGKDGAAADVTDTQDTNLATALGNAASTSDASMPSSLGKPTTTQMTC